MKRGKGGNPKKELSETEWNVVVNATRIGLTIEAIALIVGMKKRTLERRLKEREGTGGLEKGRAEAEYNVANTAYTMAVSGGNPAMTMFWLKCRAGWKETSVHEVTGKDGAPLVTIADLARAAAKKTKA